MSAGYGRPGTGEKRGWGGWRRAGCRRYSVANVVARRLLKRHPKVVHVIKLFWSVIEFIKDKSNRVQQAEYVQQLLKLQRALVPEFNPTKVCAAELLARRGPKPAPAMAHRVINRVQQQLGAAAAHLDTLERTHRSLAH